MNGIRLVQNSLRNIVRFKMRSFFMSIGVAVGVATLIAGSSVGTGAAQKISAQIDQMFGPGTILIGSAELKLPDLQFVAEQMDQVVAYAPRLSLSEMAIEYGGASEQAGVSGYSANSDYVWNRSVIDGRFISDRDVDRAASERFSPPGGLGAQLDVPVRLDLALDDALAVDSIAALFTNCRVDQRIGVVAVTGTGSPTVAVTVRAIQGRNVAVIVGPSAGQLRQERGAVGV